VSTFKFLACHEVHNLQKIVWNLYLGTALAYFGSNTLVPSQGKALPNPVERQGVDFVFTPSQWGNGMEKVLGLSASLLAGGTARFPQLPPGPGQQQPILA
jgi:hypothetical protein